MPPELIVRVIGDTSQLEKSFKRASAATGKLERNLERGGRGAAVAAIGFRGLGRTVGFASAAFLGGAGLASAARAGFTELFEGQKVAAQTAAALKSTGAVAGVTAKQISTLATALQQKTGADDEAIQSSENLLLTFTRIHNEAGRGNDIFNQATKATLDLSQALGQDLQSSALQLGKALNDPVRGVTALRRVGISFSKDQQTLINRLVKTGDVLGAQKIILQEVRREVGGSAQAYGRTLPGQLKILEGSLENLAGDLAGTLAPELEKVVKRFNSWLADPANKQKIIDGFATGVRDVGLSFEFLARMIRGANSALDDFDKKRDKVQKVLGPFGFLLEGPGDAIRGFRDRVHELNVELGQVPGNLADTRTAVGAFVHDIGQGGLGSTRSPLLPRQNVQVVPRDPFADARPVPSTSTVPPAARAGITAAQRNTFFDNRISRMLDRVQDIPTLRGQIARLREIAALVQQRHDVTKDITRRLTLEDQLADIARRILDDQMQIANNDAAAAKRAEAASRKAAAAIAAANKARLDALAKQLAAGQAYTRSFTTLLNTRARQNATARRTAEQAKVFGLIGLTATGEERAPTRGNLQAGLKKAEAAISGTPLDTKAMQTRLAGLRTVLNTEFGKLTRDTKIRVGEFLDALAGKDKTGPLTPRHAVTPLRDIIAGTGLKGAALRQFELNLAGAHLATSTGRVQPIHVHTTVNLDGREIARSTTVHQERDARRKAVQTRGRQTAARQL
jgi:hypothetical protein